MLQVSACVVAPLWRSARGVCPCRPVSGRSSGPHVAFGTDANFPAGGTFSAGEESPRIRLAQRSRLLWPDDPHARVAATAPKTIDRADMIVPSLHDARRSVPERFADCRAPPRQRA